jgi:ketosteroid isomerase-like protein
MIPKPAGAPARDAPADVAHRYLTALVAGDVAAAVARLAADIIWHQPGAHHHAGLTIGRAAVANLFTEHARDGHGSFRITYVGPLLVNGELVAALVEFAAKRSIAAMAMSGVSVLRVRGGAIVEGWLFASDQDAKDEFRGH